MNLRTNAICKRCFSQRNGNAAVADVRCRRNQAFLRKLCQTLMQLRLCTQVEERWWLSPQLSEDDTCKFRGAEILLKHRCCVRSEPRSDKQNDIARLLEARRHCLRHIVQNAHNAQHRRGINAFALGLVVERDVAAGNRRTQRRAGLADAVNGRRKLRHNLRLLRVAEVQAVGCRYRRRAGAGHFARGLGHGMHRAQLGV